MSSTQNAATPPAAANGTTPASSVKNPSGGGGSTNFWLMASYATILVLWGLAQIVFIPYVLHLLVLVTAILYAACHSSLMLRQEPPATDPDNKDESMHSYSSSTSSSDKETLRKEDAYQFPIIGSVSLFGLYLAFKYLDKNLVNLLIGAYFAVVGCLALTVTIDPLVCRIAFSSPEKNRWMRFGRKVAHPLPTWLAGESPLDLTVEFSASQLISIVMAAVVCAFYLYSKPWYLNNVLGISFCLQGIERFSLGTYKIGAILLVGLFFYDIFWVFGTEVMVTVAKNLDGPIKILFPRESLTPNPETGKVECSLLGLGDIVIPGFFLSLLLRFDAHRAKQPVDKVDIHAAFPKPYFHSCLVAYVLGLITTLFVMIQFNAAQPALLYLVPACLASSFGCALYFGEVKELLDYSEEEEEEDAIEDDKAKNPEAKKDK